MKRYHPVPQKAKKTRLIDGVSITGYEDGGTYYVDFIASGGGGGQKALEKLRQEFKRIIVLDPIAQARGFWDKMVERGVVDLLVHSVDFDDNRGEVMVPDSEIDSLSEASKTKPPLNQAIESAVKGAIREVVRSAAGGSKPLSVGDLQNMNAPVISEMKVIQVGRKAPERGWSFIAYRDKIWLVDPDEWKPADGADLYQALVKNLGDEDVPNPMEADEFYDWSRSLDDSIIDIFVGEFDPETSTITASQMDAPSFRSSPLAKKVIKQLGATTIDYDGEDVFDRGQYIDTRDKLPDVMYHGTSTHSLQRILKQGLRPGNPTNWTGDNYYGVFKEHVFLTDSPIHARWHAADTARKKGGEAVVLAVKIPDKNKLTPDWDADSFSSSKEKTFDKVHKSTSSRSTVGSWKTSKAFGRFGYKGRIPASHIELEAWSPDAGVSDGEVPDWQEKYPGDRAIWDLFTKYIKDGDFDEISDAWQMAVDGGYEDEDHDPDDPDDDPGDDPDEDGDGAKNDLKEAVGSAAGNGFYFHGTTAESARQILRDGFLNPPDIGKRRAALTPRKGMVYLASNIEYALAFTLGGATEKYDFSQYADNWWWKNKGEAAIVRVKAEDMKDAEPDEDDIADIIISHERDDDSKKHALADRIFKSHVKGDPKMEQKWKELRYDPALHKAVRLVKQLLKKISRSGSIWSDIKKMVNNAAHPGRVKVHDVMFFKAPELSQIKRPNGGYTFDLIADKIGTIEKPQINESNSIKTGLPIWFINGEPVSKDKVEEVAPDAPYILEGDEFDYAWRLCNVPIQAFGIDPEMSVDAFANKHLPDGLKASKKRMEQASSSPAIALIEDGVPKLVDGWHRMGNVIASKGKTIKAICAVVGPLAESFVDIVKNHRDEDTEIYENPSRERLAKIAKKSDNVRAFIKDKKLYVFDSNTLHQTVRSSSSLDLKDAISIMLWISGGMVGAVTVTDNNRSTKWHHSKEVRDVILTNPYIKSLSSKSDRENEDFVSYYDDAIVGPWDKMEINEGSVTSSKHRVVAKEFIDALLLALRDNPEHMFNVMKRVKDGFTINSEDIAPGVIPKAIIAFSPQYIDNSNMNGQMQLFFGGSGTYGLEKGTNTPSITIKVSIEDSLKPSSKSLTTATREEMVSIIKAIGKRLPSQSIFHELIHHLDHDRRDAGTWNATYGKDLKTYANSPEEMYAYTQEILDSIQRWLDDDSGSYPKIRKRILEDPKVFVKFAMSGLPKEFEGNLSLSNKRKLIKRISEIYIDKVVPMLSKSAVDTPKKPKDESVLIEGWEVAPEQHPGDYRNAEPDDYYYHVTSKDAAPKILKKGLKPGMKALFSNYSSLTKGRVFLADKDGVDFWMEHVELHLFAGKDYNEDEDPADDVVVLRIPKKEVTAKLNADKEGSEDSRANAWYATNVVESVKNAKGGVFLGYHCSPKKIEKHDDGSGFVSHEYAPDWLHRLLEALGKNGDTEAKKLYDELDKMEDDQLSIGYKEYMKRWNDWSERGLDHVNQSGWAWIFVSDQPDTEYGEYCYKVYTLPGTLYESLTDYNHPGASAVFYKTDKGGLKFESAAERITEAFQAFAKYKNYKFEDGKIYDGGVVQRYIHAMHSEFQDDDRIADYYVAKLLKATSLLDSPWHIDKKKVKAYVEKGPPFPAIVVDDGDDEIVDGGHRLAAAKLLDSDIMVLRPIKKPKDETTIIRESKSVSGGSTFKAADFKAFLLEEKVHNISGTVYHGTPMSGLLSMLKEGVYGTQHGEIATYDSLSTSFNPGVLSLFSERRKENGLEFKVSNVRTLVMDDMLAHLLTAASGSGIEFDFDEDEMRELGERFSIPSSGRHGYALPFGFIDTLGVDACMYEYVYDSVKGSRKGFKPNDEAELCFLGSAITNLSSKIDSIWVDGASYDSGEKAEAIAAAEELCEEEDCNEHLTEAKQRPGGWIGPVYHGSRNKFLKSLDIGAHGSGIVMTSGPQKTPVIYFTSSKENARYYADPKDNENHDEYIYSAYVRMKNPLIVDEDHPLRKRHSPPQIATKAKEAGHDGFIIPDYTDGSVPSTIYGVFNNDNVKLVGSIQEPRANLGVDSEIDEDSIEVYGDDGEYYVYFQDADEKIIQGPGPFSSEREAEKEALRLVRRHNASLR